MAEFLRGKFEVKFDKRFVTLSLENGLAETKIVLDREEEKHKSIIDALDDYLDKLDLQACHHIYKCYPDTIID